MYLWINASLSRLLILWTLEEERPSFESMISLTGRIKSKTLWAVAADSALKEEFL